MLVIKTIVRFRKIPGSKGEAVQFSFPRAPLPPGKDEHEPFVLVVSSLCRMEVSASVSWACSVCHQHSFERDLKEFETYVCHEPFRRRRATWFATFEFQVPFDIMTKTNMDVARWLWSKWRVFLVERGLSYSLSLSLSCSPALSFSRSLQNPVVPECGVQLSDEQPPQPA